jgi:GT2 family glycosyltransferase
VLIVNNSPDDRELDSLRSCKVKVLESKKNLGFGGGCNLGIQYLATKNSQDLIWLLNPDTYFPKDIPHNYWQLVEDIWLRHQDLSLLGTLIETPHGELWFAQGLFKRSSGAITVTKTLDVSTLSQVKLIDSDWISGCSLMINLKKFDTIPYFDESFFLYYEDVDFCLRYASSGHLMALSSELKIIHQPSSITDKNKYNKFFHSSFSYLFILQKYVGKIVFYKCLFKFCLNMMFQLICEPQIGRAKYDGLISFLKKNLCK